MAYLPGTGAYDRKRRRIRQLSLGGYRSSHKGRSVGIALRDLVELVSLSTKKSPREKEKKSPKGSERAGDLFFASFNVF